jgi:hypothetical protein
MAETITVIASTSLRRILMADAGLRLWVGPQFQPTLSFVEKVQQSPVAVVPQPAPG